MKFNLDVPAEDIEYAANNRDSAMNPSEFEFGMGSDDTLPDDIMLGGNDGFGGFGGNNDGFGGFGGSNDGFGDFGGGNTGFGGNDGFGGGFGDGFGGFGGPGGNTGFGGPNTQVQQQDDKEFDEKVFEAIGMLFKGGWSLLKDSVKAYPTLTPHDFLGMYKRTTVTGIAFMVIGGILMLCGLNKGISCIVGGLVTSAVSFGMFALTAKKAGVEIDNTRQNDLTTANQNTNQISDFGTIETDDDFSFEESEDSEDMFTFEGDFGNDDVTQGAFGVDDSFDNSDFGDSNFGSSAFGEEDDTFGNATFADNFDEDEFTNSTSAMFGDDFSDAEDETDTLLSGAPSSVGGKYRDVEVTNGMVTRQYLFEKFTAAIENSTPKFAEYTVLSESTEEFKQWNAVVATALAVLAPANAPEVFLVSVKKKIFCYVLEIQRATWMKNKNAIVDEIVNAVSYDKATNKRNPRIYGTGEFAAKSLYVKIVTGDTALVTVRDILMAEKEYFLNTKNKMPVTLGISIDGTPVLDDLRYVDNMMVSGMPRMGKSWLIKSVLGQLMFFNSPDDINFYFLDPKDFASDFSTVQTPHVKKFIADDTAIIQLLRDLVHTEGTRRSELLREYNAQNIWDFKAKHPDIDLPIIYIVIDEVVTLACRMDKETSQEFQSLLLECISRLAYVGIRLILIPHLVKHNILNKSITDMITWRACVGGTIEQVASVTGDKKFKTKLTSVGDAALLHNSEVEFVHSCSIATSNDRYRETFDFIAAFWTKVDSRYVTDVEVIHSQTAFVRATDAQVESYDTREGVSKQAMQTGTKNTNTRSMRKPQKSTKTVQTNNVQADTADTVFMVDTETDDLDIW